MLSYLLTYHMLLTKRFLQTREKGQRMLRMTYTGLFYVAVTRPKENLYIVSPMDGTKELSDMSDMVNHPEHYTRGKIECLDAIQAALGDGYKYYLQGAIIKYIWRYQYKGKAAEDLAKAQFYLSRLQFIIGKKMKPSQLQLAVTNLSTEWVPPFELPDLTNRPEIAIDLETRDPNIKSLGPGWPRGDGDIIGYALAADGWSGYLPVGHEGGGNLDRRIVEKWLQKQFAAPSDKIMHNAQYDLGWIKSMGFEVNGNIIDTMVVAALMDENRFSYSLNATCYDYINKTKSEKGLVEAAKEFGVDPKGEMYKLPAMFVGEYATADAELTLELWKYLKVEIGKQSLTTVFELERDLLPCLVDMTLRGIRVDIEAMEKASQFMLKKRTKL